MDHIAAQGKSEQELAIEVERQPVLSITCGRQRVGKTTFQNVMIEICRAHGADIEVWNADLNNRANSLSLFHRDALQPAENGSIEDQRHWLEHRLQDQARHRRDVVLDVGGGLTALSLLIAELRLVELLERRGIRLVLNYLLGSERADVDYLEQYVEDGLFLPKSTVLILNAGLLTSGQNARIAFEPLMRHAAVIQSLKNGAEVRHFPALGCMAAVTDRGMSFADFAAGKQMAGFPETSFFDQERVWLWLNRDVPAFLSKIPRDWLPALKRSIGAA